MGTYTTNYNLFMPTVGEQGWGTLVNGNFSTIDSTMAGLNTRLTAVENEVNGALSCTSVTTSGKVTANGGIGTTSLTTSSTITSTGLITANGGVKGNLTGNVTGNTIGFLFVKGNVQTSGDVQYATCAAQSYTCPSKNSVGGESTNVYTFTVNKYVKSYSTPVKHSIGVYTRSEDLTGTINPSLSSRTCTITNNSTGYGLNIYYKLSTVSSYTMVHLDSKSSTTINVIPGNTYNMYGYGSFVNWTMTIPAGTTYYVKYATL